MTRFDGLSCNDRRARFATISAYGFSPFSFVCCRFCLWNFAISGVVSRAGPGDW